MSTMPFVSLGNLEETVKPPLATGHLRHEVDLLTHLARTGLFDAHAALEEASFSRGREIEALQRGRAQEIHIIEQRRTLSVQDGLAADCRREFLMASEEARKRAQETAHALDEVQAERHARLAAEVAALDAAEESRQLRAKLLSSEEALENRMKLEANLSANLTSNVDLESFLQNGGGFTFGEPDLRGKKVLPQGFGPSGNYTVPAREAPADLRAFVDGLHRWHTLRGNRASAAVEDVALKVAALSQSSRLRGCSSRRPSVGWADAGDQSHPLLARSTGSRAGYPRSSSAMSTPWGGADETRMLRLASVTGGSLTARPSRNPRPGSSAATAGRRRQ
eukprot:TRINITY_DN38534_c0_g1_i1.p1 TRINITY_DN38534_c0_g1~~TRINITY_DN38534_c0_g1_i1.p1  ORF type:complete len:336 (-),score=53.00 TRINITY_DN38534_c0_g1_i1:48-1055(-)